MPWSLLFVASSQLAWISYRVGITSESESDPAQVGPPHYRYATGYTNYRQINNESSESVLDEAMHLLNALGVKILDPGRRTVAAMRQFLIEVIFPQDWERITGVKAKSHRKPSFSQKRKLQEAFEWVPPTADDDEDN